jgi:hypothetical protein
VLNRVLAGASLSLGIWPGILLFGLGTVVLIAMLVLGRPSLRVDETGILDRTGCWGPRHIAWKEIQGFRVTGMSGQKFLVMDVRDPKKVLAGGNLLQRLLRRVNMRMIGSPVAPSISMLDMAPGEIVDAIERRAGIGSGYSRTS